MQVFSIPSCLHSVLNDLYHTRVLMAFILKIFKIVAWLIYLVSTGNGGNFSLLHLGKKNELTC